MSSFSGRVGDEAAALAASYHRVDLLHQLIREATCVRLFMAVDDYQ
jgi:hypothetical protein